MSNVSDSYQLQWNTQCSVCQHRREGECEQESRQQRCAWTGKHGGMLILLWGIVADEVNGILPYFPPHVHPRTHVHGTAHSARGRPDQL